MLEQLDLTSREGQLKALYLMFGEDREIGNYIANHPKDSLEAVLDFHMGAYEYMQYGMPSNSKKGSKARLFDWKDDQSLILSDFQAIYGIDLMTYQAHWYQFAQLFKACLYREDSLLSQAISARAPIPGNLKGEMKKHAQAKQKAWKLPLTQDEINQIELARFNS